MIAAQWCTRVVFSEAKAAVACKKQHVTMAEARESEVLERQASTSSHVSSILDRLKAPKKFELTRKRKVHSNLPPKGKRRARGEGANEPMSINPSQHVKEFPSKCLTQQTLLYCMS